MKSRSLLISICVILSSQTVVDAADLQLPKPADMFAVGFQPQPVGSTPYFDEASFRAIYPFLKPAKVTIAVGAKRVWQAGVIVTKDKIRHKFLALHLLGLAPWLYRSIHQAVPIFKVAIVRYVDRPAPLC